MNLSKPFRLLCASFAVLGAFLLLASSRLSAQVPDALRIQVLNGKTGRPVVLTVKGKAEMVVMDAGAFQRMADRVDTVESIRRGLAQAKKGLGRSVDEVFDDIEQQP